MTPAVILYGSRARGDFHPHSDVDLILAKESGQPEPPLLTDRSSIHIYPQDWLLVEAERGELFVGHLVTESVALYDPDDFLSSLRSRFRLRSSYESEKKIAAAALGLLSSRDWNSDDFLRRRFFWALRTFLISSAASDGILVYSSKDLERMFGIVHLARSIEHRNLASFQDCRALAGVILKKAGDEYSYSPVEAVGILMKGGAVARSTLQMFELRKAQEEDEGLLYS